MIMANKDEIHTFSLSIESLVKEKSIPYMDAIILYCEKTGLEIEIASKLISGALKAKIKIEAEELNFLPKSKTTKLPI
jgi:hypothetical protein